MALLKAGVVGAGVFATYHAKKYAEAPEAELAGVFDPHPERAARLADALGVAAFLTLDALLDAAEVVTVSSPADSHAAVAARALEAGRSVYVEKPLARTVEEGAGLVALARARGLVLACGHQERATFAAMGLFDAPEPARSLSSVRRGPPGPRSRDVSCVLDLMIHDLDLALQLGGGEARAVEASGHFDEVRAEVAFASGLRARLEASRVADARERTMRLAYGSGEVEVDFLAPAFADGSGLRLDAGFAATPMGRDPLGASVRAFLAAVRGERERPLATGAEGMAALALALQVERAAGL